MFPLSGQVRFRVLFTGHSIGSHFFVWTRDLPDIGQEILTLLSTLFYYSCAIDLLT